MATVQTPACVVCGETSTMKLDDAALKRFHQGAFVQDAFPDLPADQREQLISGTHPACWESMFADLPDDER